MRIDGQTVMRWIFFRIAAAGYLRKMWMSKPSKFGVDMDRAERVFGRYGGNGIVDLCAIHVHLGSGGRTIFILDMFNSVG